MPNIKGNQTKFDQFIKYNTKNVFFLIKSDTKCGVKTSPRPFSRKKQNSAYLWIDGLNIYSLFLFYIQVEDYQNIFKLRCCTLAFMSYKTFLQNEKRSGTSLTASFFSCFEEKHLSCYILLNGQISLSDCLYFTAWDIG